MASCRAACGYAMVGVYVLGVVLLATACSGDETVTELIVVIDTDYDVPSGLDEIALDVEGPSGMQYPVSAMLGLADSPPLPLYTFLEPAGDELGPILITATGRLAGTELVVRTVRTSFIPGESRTVYIMLLRGCAGVDCAGETSCTETGCATIDVPPESLPLWTGSPTGPDAGTDVGTDGGDACVPSAEACNGVDDDCDGDADEDFNLTTDSQNCGACGTVCADQARASVSCTLGTCTLECDPGFADCDDDLTTGCESDLTAPATCGDCDTACAAPTPLCDSATGCVDDCATGSTLCGMACVNTGTNLNGCEERLASVSHCGACGTGCTPSCSGGSCGFSCDSGFDDCDGSASNGCETTLVPLFQDSDGDGYGDSTGGTMAGTCMAMSGWVPLDGDCDDTRASVNPGATEVCNLRDDDCNGTSDDGLTECGESCTTPMVVTESIAFTGIRACGGTDDDDPDCDAGSGIPDQVYRIDLADTTRLDYAVMGRGDEVLWITNRCERGAPQLVCDDELDFPGSQTLSAGTWYVYIERGGGCFRTYDVQFMLGPP